MFKKENSSNHAHQTLFSLITSFFYSQIKSNHHYFCYFPKEHFFFLLYFTRLILVYIITLLFIIIIISWFGGSHGWSGWCFTWWSLGFCSFGLLISVKSNWSFLLTGLWYSRVSPRLFFFFRRNVYIWWWDLFLRIYSIQLAFYNFSFNIFSRWTFLYLYFVYSYLTFLFFRSLESFSFCLEGSLDGGFYALWDENVVMLRLREMCCWLFVLFGIVLVQIKSCLLLPSIPFPPSLLIYLSNICVVLLITMLILVFYLSLLFGFPIISWSLLNFDGINLTLIN